LRAAMSYLKLDCGYRADTDIDNAVSGREYACDDCVLHHLAGSPRIATNDDRAGAGVRTERLRETRQQ